MSGSDSGAQRASLTPAARSAAAGVALVNGTPNITGLTTPNDGQLHCYDVAIAVHVTSLETGGAVSVIWTCGGQAYSVLAVAGGQAAGPYQFGINIVADPNTTVGVAQTSALTAGAATAFAAISGG
jgi:hypothetical protein